MKIVDTRYGFNQPLTAKFLRYENGQTAITLATPDGEPWLIARCIPGNGTKRLTAGRPTRAAGMPGTLTPSMTRGSHHEA